MAWDVLCRGDKNYMGCFVRGGKLMRDVLSGVTKNGMGCFVAGCFVLHSLNYYFTEKMSIHTNRMSKQQGGSTSDLEPRRRQQTTHVSGRRKLFEAKSRLFMKKPYSLMI